MKVWCCLLAALPLAYAQNQPGKGVNLFSCEKEAALGLRLAEETRRDIRGVPNRELQEYLETIGQRLAAHIPVACPAPFAFTPVADATVTSEPFALPGGYLFVPTGLILSARSEAEVAGMLAHSMAHIAERHGTRLSTRAELASQAAMPFIHVGSPFAVRQGAITAIPLGLLRMQRQMELAADRSAVQAMAAAGYDPAAFVAYLERTQTDPASPQFSPIPPRETRIAALTEAIADLPPAGYGAPDGLARVQEIVRRLTSTPPRSAPSLRKP